MSQSHGTSLWTEPAGSGAVPAIAPAYFVKSGSNWTVSTTGPAQGAAIDIRGDGTRWRLIDLTVPVYLVDNGSGGVTANTTGPATWILVAGANPGDVTLSSTLTDTPVADLMYDTAGNFVLVRRGARRLQLVKVRGNYHPYGN